MWTTTATGSTPQASVSTLSDEAVLTLAASKMDAVQNERLGALQAKGKISGLTEAERTELLALLHPYQAGQLWKSEGLAKAVRRGLRFPLSSEEKNGRRQKSNIPYNLL